MVKITEETRARHEKNSAVMASAFAAMSSKELAKPVQWSIEKLQSYEEASAEKSLYRHLRSKMSTAEIRDMTTLNEQMAVMMKASPDPAMAYLRGLALKEDGAELFASQDYERAIVKFKSAIRAILADDSVEHPSPCYLYGPYLSFGSLRSTDARTATKGGSPGVQWAQFVDIMALLSNIVACHVKLERTVETIDSILELEQFLACVRLTSANPPLPVWQDFHIGIGEYWVLRFKMWLRAIALFRSLGNTAVATAFGQMAMGDYGTVSPELARTFPKLATLHKELTIDWFKHRHPEPNISERHVQDASIQVLGVWERQSYAPSSLKPNGRTQPSIWVWRGSLYVAGGSIDGGGPVCVCDMWSFDLKTRVWRRLPDIPVSQLRHDPTATGLTDGIRVWKDRAYCFSGTLKVAVFDLVTETWGIVQTIKPKGKPWPYDCGGEYFSDYATAIFEGVLYVFAGDDGLSGLGTNIFMALDIATCRWTHISGISEPKPKIGEPDFRTDPAMWAVPSERRIYVLHGSAKRSAAYMRKHPLGFSNDHTYGDLWSYHVDERQWRREKLRGNYASPRTETAYCWSPSLQRAVIYGGYNGSMPTMDDSKAPISVSPLMPGSMFHYAYFGDTFLFDPATRLWQHVLVKGFPSYRAGSALVCDPDDGKLYMFGGYTNAQYVPANRDSVRMYSDLWQLKIDLPGGCWDPKDLERDIRLERAGPWMRCFTCGNCGINWQKCGGTCGGKLYFCSRDCQKNGWKEHKETHGCRKRG